MDRGFVKKQRELGQQSSQMGKQYGGKGWERNGHNKKGQRLEVKKVDCDTMLVKTGLGAR